MAGSEETFHQKVSTPGPVTVANREAVPLSRMPVLCAASTPSWVTTAWPIQEGEALVVQASPGASTASASVIRGVTVRKALKLVTAPAGLEMTTE